ncbi:hypothetical protein CRG98_043608 [Punica granatum]|nr:hypothetical protein CRG98_043608 [Punica granatum]
MKVHHVHLIGYLGALLLLLSSLSHCSGATEYPYPKAYDTSNLNRSSFPDGFIFGAGSSSYQYEGAAHEDGRGPGIWDTFTSKYPEKIADRSNGDVAIDSYHRYKEDVAITKEMDLDSYRLSISWPRILPKGKLSGGVNHKGIKYYNNLINELLANGIQPFVTLFHWDVPQTLEDEYGGPLSPLFANDFRDFVDLCFKEFGDRVKHWITLNEPHAFTNGGYAQGILAPGRCSEWQQLNCTGGNSATEPYLVSHHLLLAHAFAVKLYREKYQESQKGRTGITLDATWSVAYSNSKQDHDAAVRSLDFNLGWLLNPLTFGHYPHSMRAIVGNRLPKFTKEQSLMLKGSFDFLGINYYTSYYARPAPPVNGPNISYTTDALVQQLTERNGIPIGPQAASNWLFVYPKGIRDLLVYIKNKYGNPEIYITENGVDEPNNSTLPLEQQLADNKRIDYHYKHLSYVLRAIGEGVRVKGYFAWSLMDDFEWGSGYTVRFGINYVDYENGLKRYPKYSSFWFKNFLNKY